MNKLFDDTIYIDKNIITKHDKKKWKKEFEGYCASDEIRKETADNGLNACGYYYACDLCENYNCANATIEYLENKGIEIDYKNISKEYLDKILRFGDTNE